MENSLQSQDIRNENKRIKRPHNSVSRKRTANKVNRNAGLEYLGFSTKKSKIKQDTIRKAREMGPSCSSQYCQKSKFRHCEKFNESTRSTIFSSFWELSPSAKQMFIQCMARSVPIKNSRIESAKKKQNFTYFLNLNGVAVQICRSLFLSTLGLKRAMVRGWLTNSPGVIKQQQNHSKPPNVRQRNVFQVARKIRLSLFLEDLDKMDSHYCRRDSKKNYIAATFRSKAALFEHYRKYIRENGYGQSVSFFTFSEEFDKRNLALFKPRKDQCDTCVGFTAGQITKIEYDLHVAREKRAQSEKTFDKKAALEKRRHVFSSDVQAVKLSPDIDASAIYYKTRLQVHNFTMYNLANHQCTNYWWDETQGDLSASSFVSCVIQHLQKYCLGDTLPIVLFSDGCGYQNRNQFLANALSNFAIENNKIIEQKWLEKGHTQMECDSAHAKIERRLEKYCIFVPFDYIDVTKQARKTVKVDNIRKECPFDAEYLTYDFFQDYAYPEQLRFTSIRPGTKAHDPTVTELRSMIYLPDGRIMYKIDFNDEYRNLPRKIQPYNVAKHQPRRLHNNSLKIKKSKFMHLQELKKVIPTKHHSFYDSLKFE